MRKLLILLLSAVLLLVGCSDDSSSNADEESSDLSPTSITGVSVGGDDGAKPDVTIDTPVSVDETAVDTLTEGDGDEVAEGDTVVVDYLGLLGRTGEQFDSSYDRGQPAVVTTDGVIPGIEKAVVGQTVGSRVVVAVAPSDGFGPQGQPDAGIEADDTLIFVIDIVAKPEFKPTGIAGVALSDDRQPMLKLDAPVTVDETQVEVLREGDGSVVKPGNEVTVNYVGANGRTGATFESSYASGQPATFTTDGVVKGFAKALEEQKVGSRVVVAMTSEDGYGSAGNPQIGIQGGDPLVFVIDILDTAGAPSESPSESPASPPESPSASPS